MGASRYLLPLPSPRPGRDIISRSRPPGQLSQVATSIPCRDLLSAQLKPPRSRPQKMGSRHQFQQARSRPQIDVATSLCFPHRKAPITTQNLGRDTRPPPCSQNHVATSNRCRDITKASPGRDLKNGVATFNQLSPCLAGRNAIFHVATWGFSLLVTTEISFVETQAHPACLAPPGRDLLVRSRLETKNGQ